MTEIEKQFFEAFGIKAIAKCVKPDIKRINPTFCEYYKNCTECDYCDYKYPSITNRILLELICIHHSQKCPRIPTATNIEKLKNNTLLDLTHEYLATENEKLKGQIRALFREGK